MEYTRYSSQAATVDLVRADLVRADLAEIWTIGEDETESPKRPPSVSGISDMLDLEYIPTPGLRPSKTMRKDPLPGLLGDVLELSPSRKRGRNDPAGKCPPSQPPETGNKRSSRVVQSRNGPTQDSAAANRLSSPAIHSGSPEEPHDCPQGTQEPTLPARIRQPSANTNKRSGLKQQNKRTESIADSPATSPVPDPRRPRQSNSKQAASFAAPKGSKKASSQAKTHPKTSNPAPTWTKTKPREHDGDVFALSDVTDTDEELRPKKRQAKQPSPKRFRSLPEPKARNVNKGAARGGSSDNKGNKPTETKPIRVPKNPLGRDVARGNQIEVEPTHSDTAAYDGQEVNSNIDPDQHENNHTPDRIKPNFDEQPQMTRAALSFRKTDSPQESLSPELPKHRALASKDTEPLLPHVLNFRDVINVSSESVGEGNGVAGSTSPLFMEQDQQHITSGGSDIAVIVNPATSSDQMLPTRLLTNHTGLGYTPPPSFQPPAFAKQTAMRQTHSASRPLPAALREAFSSDEQPKISPSPAPELNPCLEEESLNPEDIWKQAVEDNSPPAVMHRIVTLLHRSLKPREEVVYDIAADYRENGLRLLNNLSARHDQELADTTTTLRRASRGACSVFSGAGQDMAILISRLREMDVTHTTDTLTRPVLVQKLDAVARLCQTKLDNHTITGPAGDDSVSESEGNLDNLSETYRVKLFKAVRRPDDTSDTSGKANLQVDDFIKRCLRGEPKRVHNPPVNVPEKRTPDADGALEVFLDGIISTLQEKSERCNLVRAENMADVVSEDSDGAGMGRVN